MVGLIACRELVSSSPALISGDIADKYGIDSELEYVVYTGFA